MRRNILGVSGLLLGLVGWAGPAQAVTFWTEDFEDGTAVILSSDRWPSSSNNPGCVGDWPTSGVLTVSADRAFSGTKSVKFHQVGHQQKHITDGQTGPGTLGFNTNIECTVTRRFPASTDVWYTYYEYIVSGFQIDEIGTKGIGNAGAPIRMGWATVYKWGSFSNLAFSCERCNTTASNGTTEYYPNMNGGWTTPTNAWVCYEQHFRMNDLNTSNATYEAFATNMTAGTPVKQFAGHYNQRWLGNTTGTTWPLPSDNKFFGYTMYVQDGIGDRYVDKITISTTRVGCGAGGGGDTEPPAVPTGLNVSWLLDLADSVWQTLTEWVFPNEAMALTNSAATVTWDKTSDPTIRYELRWQHFKNGWVWTNIATNLDSTTGLYRHTFPPLEDSTGDRGACWDARVAGGAWLSETGKQVCVQMPLGATPVPIPLPTPVPSGLTISKSTPSEIVITATKVACPTVRTSTAGSTTTMSKRTVRCVQ